MPLFAMNRRRGIGLAALALVVTLVLAWDWTWFRPLIQNHVRERSGREVSFDKLHIGLDGALSPRVAFTGLRVQNAPWAAKKTPLITAGEIAFTLQWASLFEDKLVVTHLRLVDADVDMERQTDGLRNWRLTRPDDKGPGRIKVLTLEALRSRIHVIHAGVGLEFDGAATPLATMQTLAKHPELPLQTSIVFSGSLAGTPFEGVAATGPVLSFVDSAMPFGLRGKVRAAGVDLAAEGIVADMMALGRIDVDVRARLGRSDAAGHLVVHRDAAADARPALRASLTSERIDVQDFARSTPAARAASAAPRGASPAGHRLRSFDAEVDWRVSTLAVPSFIALRDARVQASLAQGVLTVQRADIKLAGGSVAGQGRFDASGEQPTLALTASASGVHLDAFAARWPQAGQLGGELDAQLAWQARGDSPTALMRTGTGMLAASLAHASIPAALDAKLALDGAGVVAALFRRGDRVAVHCGSVQIEFKNGKGTTRQLHVDTERVALAGHGRVDLGDENFELLLTPHLHRSALFALQKSVQVAGRLDSPKITLVERDETSPVTTCAPRG
jgi:uncharacterized protein involved in outer membrane biogenesis